MKTPEVATLNVQLIGRTEYLALPLVDIDDAEGGQALAEFAGRACYQSWDKPNAATASNAGYLANIIKQLHGSVLEHGSVSFYITGVSRSLTHELVRHRHLSYSQLSQRYVDSSEVRYVVPAEIRGNVRLEQRLARAVAHAVEEYEDFTTELAAELEADETLTKTERRKRVRQAARAVLPNCVETKIVVTGNYRAWREFLDKRATPAADREIRGLAIAVYSALVQEAGNVFADFHAYTLADGSSALYRTAP